MNVTMQDLCSITEDVMTTVLGLAAIAAVTPRTAAPAAPWLESRIGIHGRWSGELTVACGPQLAALLASAFFGEPVSIDRVDDADAALRELANILAGHVNALMAAPSRISLPHSVGAAATTAAATGRVPDLIAAFCCEDQELLVTLRETTPPGGGEA